MLFFKLEADKINQNPNILAIGIKSGENRTRIWGRWQYESEKSMVSDFAKWFLEEKDKIIVGFNILKFELPVLLLKLSIYSKNENNDFNMEKFEKFFLKLNRSNILDLFVILTFLRKGKIKGFKDYCMEIDIKFKERKEILNLYYNSQYKEFEDAITLNLNALQKLFLNCIGKND